ncbi:TPA: hypothetical protein ACX6QH_000422 [Photobacterium damselae]
MRLLANKHANIKVSAYQEKTRYVLLHNNQLLADVYDAWSVQLSKEYAFKTVETYVYAVANFLDYVEELSIELVEEDFRRCIDGYESYLVYGVNSFIDFSHDIVKQLNDLKACGYIQSQN